MDSNSLSHTKWNCKYHIVFAPKYRRKVAYGKIKQDIANRLSMLCKRKGVKIVEAEICPDHVHMLVEIPPSISVSYFVGYLKGKSTLMIFERHANLKYKYGNRHFWCRQCFFPDFKIIPINNILQCNGFHFFIYHILNFMIEVPNSELNVDTDSTIRIGICV